eukprot:jgi/Chlat1/1170/Chrsp113S01642
MASAMAASSSAAAASFAGETRRGDAGLRLASVAGRRAMPCAMPSPATTLATRRKPRTAVVAAAAAPGSGKERSSSTNTTGVSPQAGAERGRETVYEAVVAVMDLVPGPRVGGGDWPVLVAAPLAFLGGTFAFSTYKYLRKYFSPRQKRKRLVNKNLTLAQELNKYLPEQRDQLTPAVIASLRTQLGFTEDQIFRKYLRYLLNERPFDTEEVADILQLRRVCGLKDEQVADVLNESARKMCEKTGVLMINPRGMSAQGLQRKAMGRALFQKLLYLSELEELIAPDSPAKQMVDIIGIFGATESDANGLRLTSLGEFDADRFEKLIESTADEPGTSLGSIDDDDPGRELVNS